MLNNDLQYQRATPMKFKSITEAGNKIKSIIQTAS